MVEINRCLKFRRMKGDGKPSGCAIGGVFECLAVYIRNEKFKDFKFTCCVAGTIRLPPENTLIQVPVWIYYTTHIYHNDTVVTCWYDENNETLYLNLDDFVNPKIWE
jgi:hypothetical protein